ncbi:MAG TPA: thioredoxin domain-containing protein, partial [Gaiellaceae bacterium]
MPNRLAQETSPYLLQHADNPVDWYPWGDEAFARARDEDRPILLSVGYAACHWCHVMEHESFEDTATADLMNEGFVNVKVDREERPDVDAVYMEAVVALTGQGGWPMTMFLTPDGEPFYGGTYFPPEPRHGMPAFRQVLEAVAEAYREQRDDVARQAQTLVAALRQSARRDPSREPLTESLLGEATRGMLAQLDPRWGGFGRAPKFPPASALE